MDNNDIKKKIVDGINYAREKLNFKLIKEDWGSKEGAVACALGCTLLANDRHLWQDNERNECEAMKLLGVSEVWVSSFIAGFDTDDREENTLTEPYELGKELSEKYQPVASENTCEEK